MITREKVLESQIAWGDSVVNMGKIYLRKGDVKSAAEMHVTEFYGYQEGQVLFKPTKASKMQFRGTFESAVSYFVGNDPEFPEDHGFALQPWILVRFENAGMILEENSAYAMGNYYFTALDGKETKVEYTFGYFLSKEGKLKINIHHSSLPFNV